MGRKKKEVFTLNKEAPLKIKLYSDEVHIRKECEICHKQEESYLTGTLHLCITCIKFFYELFRDMVIMSSTIDRNQILFEKKIIRENKIKELNEKKELLLKQKEKERRAKKRAKEKIIK